MRIPRLASTLFVCLLASCGVEPQDEPTAAESISSVRAVCDDGDDCRPLRIRHVLLISIDGMHQVDLARFIADHPGSTLAELAESGIEYTNAWVNRLDGTPSNPTDSFPGLLALVTGGSSPTTGGWYDVSYARDLFPDASCALAGTPVAYDEGAELDNTNLWGAPGAAPTHDPDVVRSRLDPAKLPFRKTAAGCAPVFPHAYLRVNTIFEVAHAAGLHTAWSDKHLAYELVTGPSGTGLDDFFAPEINSAATNLPGTGAGASDDFTTRVAFTEVYDDFKVQAIVNQIQGKWSDDGLAGATDALHAPGVPAIFGMNFQAVSVAQKDARFGPGGYLDAEGTPSPELAGALAHTDASIGRMIAELRARRLDRSTLVIVTAKHGQSPIDRTLVAKRNGDAIAALVDAAAPVAGHIEDDVALYWLADSRQAQAGAAALEAAPADGSATDPSVDRVLTTATPGFVRMFGDPTRDPRTPDIVVQPRKGTIYSLSAKKFAEHGGFADDDAHVALLVSNPALERRQVHRLVRTKQVAPTILRALGLDPDELQAVRAERTHVLPHLHSR
jgi:type I phosphodiesterase/nucleotide pyrophosphatase